MRSRSIWNKTKGRGVVGASVMPTVIVVSVLLMLLFFGLLMTVDMGNSYFHRLDRARQYKYNIESGVLLVTRDPSLLPDYDSITLIRLSDTIPGAELTVTRKRWGLYDMVGIVCQDGSTGRNLLVGIRGGNDEEILYYTDARRSLTLAGETYIEGPVKVPSAGIIYGQMHSVFFSGNKLEPEWIGESGPELPRFDERRTAEIFDSFSGDDPSYDPGETGTGPSGVFTNSFSDQSVLLDFFDPEMRLSGNIVICSEEVNITGSGYLRDVLIIADKITIEDGFRGSLQCFARDSVTVGENVVLEYPSGIFTENYACLGKESEINGYVICIPGEKAGLRSPNVIKTSGSVLRGLLFSAGPATVQGLVSGKVVMERSLINTPQGYYRDLLTDLAVLPAPGMAYPFMTGEAAELIPIKYVP